MKNKVLFIIALLIIMVGLFHTLRPVTYPAGDQAYRHLLADDLNPYHQLLFNQYELSLSLVYPVLLSVLLLFGIYRIFRPHFSFFLILLFTPAFLLLTFTSTDHSLAMVIGTLIAASLKAKRYYKLWSLLLFAVLGLFSYEVVAIAAVITLLWKRKPLTYTGVLIMVLVALAAGHRFVVSWQAPLFISDFGALIGFGVFNVVLLGIGLVMSRVQRKRQRSLYVMLLVLLLLSFWDKHALLYLVFPITYLSSLGVQALYKRKWDLPLLKSLTFIILIVGVIFSTVSYVHRAAVMEPSANLIEALTWFDERSPDYAHVLSHPSQGHIIRYFSHRDANIVLTQQELELFASRNLKETLHTMDELDITHILIDEEMRTGQVWQEVDEGLLFLLDDPAFKKVYDNPTVELWALR